MAFQYAYKYCSIFVQNDTKMNIFIFCILDIKFIGLTVKKDSDNIF